MAPITRRQLIKGLGLVAALPAIPAVPDAKAKVGQMGWSMQNIIARLVIIQGENDGLFVYDGPPAAGKLVASIASTAGTDRVGNAYLAGITSYNGAFYSQLEGGNLAIGNTSWSAPTDIETPSDGLLSLSSPKTTAADVPMFVQAGSVSAGGPSVAFITGSNQEIWLGPSGDTTGATDSANIAAAFAGALFVHLMPGLFYINAPILMNTNYQVLQGAGFGFTSTIVAASGFSGAGMVIASGATAPLDQVTIRDLALKGNATSGHGIVFRSDNGLIENVIVQGNPDGDCFHLALDALTPVAVFDVTMINCYAMQPGDNGYFIDNNFNSCEFHLCRGQGGTAPGSPGGTWGIQALGGQLKFVDCHMYEFVSGGATFGNGSAGTTDITVIGGEYETNSGPGIVFNLCGGGRIIGAEFYGSTGGEDILLATATGITIDDCHMRSAVTRFVLLSDCQECSITDNRMSNASATNTIGVQLEASTPVNSSNRVSGNQITINGAGFGAILLQNTQQTVVEGNICNLGITESGTADYSLILGNILTAGAVTLVGAHSIDPNNIA